uniref:Hemagglutinin glycoprotein n=1 Tax=Measles morbillivirus TaxID=11234 RepID=F1BCZ7_9MONO|nr:hemagglutinin [Measles morbillivirus]ADZ13737.1 hemagglutinin [Measles morbillivirus]ADZ13738.1 hemagglutinin [Measles morbillivirus]ADZ13740.1 hemagglutinin [Measles morbillivirus]ADZ13746.1 hemagglutinin [Measles morbillivirus]
MSPQRDRINAFYKDNPHPKGSRIVINREHLMIDRPYVLLVVLFVMFLSLIGLLAIAGIRLHRAAIYTAEIHKSLSTNLDVTNSIEHQVKDVLTPLFKIIGDEVGLRTPQRFTDLVKFISDKIKFLNPDREYDFRDLTWCINPPERIKLDYDQYCADVAAEELMNALVNSTLLETRTTNQFLAVSKGNCSGPTTIRGQFSNMSLSLLDLYLSRGYNVSSIVTMTSQGMYGGTYLVEKPNLSSKGSELPQPSMHRVFEVGVIRNPGLGAPVFHMTNYLEQPVNNDFSNCMVALGELKLAALCHGEDSITIPYQGSGKGVSFQLVKLGVWKSPTDMQSWVPLSTDDPVIDRLYLSSHRGIIADNQAKWGVPTTRTDDKLRMETCFQQACKGKIQALCENPEWAPLKDNRIPSYGVLSVDLSLTVELKIKIASGFGPLITHGSGMDLYKSNHNNVYWLTIPPMKNLALGVINTLEWIPGFKVSPNLFTVPIKEAGEDCHAPTYLPAEVDGDVKLSSNLVILPGRDLQYVLATYDTSRVEHAVVYYVYSPSRSFSYFYPFRLPIKGVPIELQVECFTWDQKLWCRHFCVLVDSESGGHITHSGMVGMGVSCTATREDGTNRG